MRLLAISGSLRPGSSNTTLLRAAARLAPDGVDIHFYSGLADLPHFNPDLDREPAPLAVADLRSQLAASDGVLISSPEYAHGVPGTLKNALDWLVGSGELVYKPVALLSASPRSVYAQASLRETLTVMTASLVEAASVTIPLPSNRIGEDDIVSNPEFCQALRAALTAFTHAIDAHAGLETEGTA